MGSYDLSEYYKAFSYKYKTKTKKFETYSNFRTDENTFEPFLQNIRSDSINNQIGLN